jgi:hypothetical protein
MAAAGLARGGNLPPSPWLGVTPFGIKTVRQFSASEVRTFTRSGEIVPDYFLQRSKLFNGVNTAAAVEFSEGWLGVKPVVSWNRIARQISSVCGVDLAGQAQVLAMLNVALADAMISTLHWRYTIGSWRSIFVNGWIEGIPSQPADGSLPLLAAWQPGFMQIEPSRALIPPMANYPSLGSALAGAAQAALRNFFNTDEITFTLPVMAHAGDGGAVARTFTKISDAAREHAFVASVGGREIREACIAGYSLGTSIGGYVSKRRLPLRP